MNDQDANKTARKVKKPSSEKAKMDIGKKRPGWSEDQKSAARKISRARMIDSEVAKILKRAPKLLSEQLDDSDRRENLNVVREAKRAMTRHYDLTEKKFIEFPDFKTRLAATTLQLAYDEGTPVQRQIMLTASFDSADKTIAKIKESPELLRAIQALQGVGLTLENGSGEPIDIQAEELSEGEMVTPETENRQAP